MQAFICLVSNEYLIQCYANVMPCSCLKAHATVEVLIKVLELWHYGTAGIFPVFCLPSC